MAKDKTVKAKAPKAKVTKTPKAPKEVKAPKAAKAPVETEYAGAKGEVQKCINNLAAKRNKLVKDGSKNRARKITSALEHLARANKVLY